MAATTTNIPPTENYTEFLSVEVGASPTASIEEGTLLQNRLLEIHGIPLSETFMVQDNEDESEEKKEEDTATTSTSFEHSFAMKFDRGEKQNVAEIKTLVWEVVAVGIGATRREKVTRKKYIVAALQMKDKVHLPALKSLVLRRMQEYENPDQRLIWSVQSMQLAPLKIAEGLTGYKSGCMPPICHSSIDDVSSSSDCTNMELYLDRSIVDIYFRASKRVQRTASFASIGSGIMGKSLMMDLGTFLQVAGAHVDIKENATDSDMKSTACTVESFVAGASYSDSTIEDSGSHGDNNTGFGTTANTGNEQKMMSGYELRKLQQEERKQQREMRKDRLKEYRSFRKDDIVSKAKLLRTTARKKGRIQEMEILLKEALTCGEFSKLMEIPDEQSPRTNIDKNALHICAWRGDYETVVRLVEISREHCPELDVVNLISKGLGNYGKTPIFYALTQCREDVVRYLVLEAGADLLIVNNKGQTPCSIARSHMTEETCQLLYKTEAEQLAARSLSVGGNGTELFANYRASIHSDGKLYGDLDPRFPIDDDNRYYQKKGSVEDAVVDNDNSDNGRWASKNGFGQKVTEDYMDRNDDLTDQIKEYEESVRLAPEESIVQGIPTVFSPRSLRATVRWWNRDDKSLAAANDNNYDSGGQITFTQSRPQGSRKPVECRDMDEKKKRKGKSTKDDNNVSRFSEIDIDSLELVSISDCINSGIPSGDGGSDLDSTKILVDDVESLSRFEAEVDNCLSELNHDLESRKLAAEEGSLFGHDEEIILKYAWGLDCEWKPGPECGLDSPVSTLQLGTRRNVFLIDMQTICRKQESLDEDSSMERSLDSILLKIFRNPNLPLVGFGVVQDLGKLAASFSHLKCSSEFSAVMDLQSISSVIYKNKRDRRMMSSLQKMTAVLLNKRLDKAQQVSDWSNRPLSNEQISYAMLDAAIIPLLLKTIVEDSDVVERYNGQFFNVHNNLLSTIRYTLVEPCEEGFVYEMSFGSIKSTLGKAFARQNWPTKMKLEEPAPPKLVACQAIADGSSSSMPTTSKKERAHLRKVGDKGRKRPKPIPLKSLTGNLENLPIPGIFLGYTKESCAFRVVGHELFKTIPEGTYIGFNRRAGVVETSNAWILFCNFGGEKSFSEFANNGRQLSFRVNSTAQSGRSSESSMYREMISNAQSPRTHPSTDKKKIILFARESTRTKYMYCGLCSCTKVLPLDSDTASLVLKLEDYDKLMKPDLRISSDFEHLVAGI